MNILEISWQALFLQILAFLLLIWLMRKYLFGPITGILEARQNEVQQTLDRIYQDREAMETTRRDNEARHAGI
jgi:F-type H+-transporting ATPase subunit b